MSVKISLYYEVNIEIIPENVSINFEIIILKHFLFI